MSAPKKRLRKTTLAPTAPVDDFLQLQVLVYVLRHVDAAIPASIRLTYADALERFMNGDYPSRANNRPRKDARNFWLAVDLLIRCQRPGAKNYAESDALATLCASHHIAISAAALRRLPKQYPGAERVAEQLLVFAASLKFRDTHDAASRIACGFWLRAEAADAIGRKVNTFHTQKLNAP